MSLITIAVCQLCIKVPVGIKISTKFIPGFEVIVVSRKVQMKLEMDAVIIPKVRSVILQKRAVEISEGHSRNFRSTQKIRKKCTLVFYFRRAQQ